METGLRLDSLKRVWFTSGSSDLWNCDGTYCGIPGHMLPKLEGIGRDFAWLDETPRDGFSCTLDSTENKIGNLVALVRAAPSFNLELPPEFIDFMANDRLHRKVPTCTACFLELSDTFIPVPGAEGAYVLRFMNDSQGCVMWYLLFHGSKPPRVLASPWFFEPDIFAILADGEDEEEVKYADILDHAVICADSFLEFIYRFWVENAIWFAEYGDRHPLSPREAAYKAHITTKPR
jgi:hypothetical protein